MEEHNDIETYRSKVRVAIAGLGRATFERHLPALMKLPALFRVVAICDLLKERRARVERQIPDVRTYRQVEDMLDDPDVDLVVIALPSAEHHRPALSALRRNRWTLVESPLAFEFDDANLLRAASVKNRGKLIPFLPGLFSPEFRLAMVASEDRRLGDIHDISIRRQDYLRRDDWQSVKRCGGGCAYREGSEVLLQAMSLMHTPPTQMLSVLKRVASLGDAEDYMRILLRGRGDACCDILVDGGAMPPLEPAFTLRGDRGTFTVAPGATEGHLVFVDPAFKFPRRRSSVRTPSLEDAHEQPPMVEETLKLPADSPADDTAFWRAVYATVRTAAPFPISVDDYVDTVRFINVAKTNSAFAR